jgi:hypothetical protein
MFHGATQSMLQMLQTTTGLLKLLAIMFEKQIKTSGLQPTTTCLQMEEPYQLQRLTCLLKGMPANHTYWQQPLLLIRTKLFNHQLSPHHVTQHIPATRRQQSEIQVESLLGSECVEQSSMIRKQQALKNIYTHKPTTRY